MSTLIASHDLEDRGMNYHTSHLNSYGTLKIINWSCVKGRPLFPKTNFGVKDVNLHTWVVTKETVGIKLHTASH